MDNSFVEESKQLTVTVVDGAKHNLNAEAVAMLSALTSRSQAGPQANLALVKEKGPEAFMSKFYIGYGHGSIGKCGTTNVFVSGLSMLAINFLQNINPLYTGQESSTRYIPFSNEGVYLPGHLESEFRPWMDKMISIYETIQPMVKEHLMSTLTKPDDASDDVWERTINARVFDICRSMLPAGCKTVGVWNGNLENFKQILTIALFSDNDEVRDVADEIYCQLQATYPSSFPDIEPSDDMTEWYRHLARANFLDEETLKDFQCEGRNGYSSWCLQQQDIQKYLTTLPPRPKYMPLPDVIGTMGRVNTEILLDFGGFRDINRHRKGNCQRSPLTMRFGLHPWYLSQMPDNAAKLVRDFLGELKIAYDTASARFGNTDLEYVVPMGMRVVVKVSYPFDNFVYTSELRSKSGVHPTVREVAMDMGKYLHDNYPDFNFYHDVIEDDTLDVRRANDDIFIKD